MPKVLKIPSLQYFNTISRIRGGINYIFCMMIIIKFLCKLIPSFLLVIARHALRSQKSKFAIYQERRDECDFLHANKHQILLQIKAINFGGHG